VLEIAVGLVAPERQAEAHPIALKDPVVCVRGARGRVVVRVRLTLEVEAEPYIRDGVPRPSGFLHSIALLVRRELGANFQAIGGFGHLLGL
jgi:hypothetical protein